MTTLTTGMFGSLFKSNTNQPLDICEKFERCIERTTYKDKELLTDILINAISKYGRSNVEHSVLVRRGFLKHVCEKYMTELFGEDVGFSMEVDRGSEWLHFNVDRKPNDGSMEEASRLVSACMSASKIIVNYY